MGNNKHTVKFNGIDAAFSKHSSVLELLEQHNIETEYQCRSGFCGACRLKKISGEVHYKDSPLAFIQSDEILSCCSIPATDLVLETV